MEMNGGNFEEMCANPPMSFSSRFFTYIYNIYQSLSLSLSLFIFVLFYFSYCFGFFQEAGDLSDDGLPPQCLLRAPNKPL